MQYTLKVWLTTVLLSPIFIISYFASDHNANIQTIVQLFCVMLITGLLFSAPVILIFGLLNEFFKRKNFSLTKSKLLLSIISVIGVSTTFYLVNPAFISSKFENSSWPIFYSSTMTLSTLVYKRINISVT